MKLHFPVSEDKNLAENLLLHINMAMERIQSGITVTNPMLEDIYQSDPKLYEIVKESFRNIRQWYPPDASPLSAAAEQ